MEAIQTVYKGYRFRSRLEARWAVFFDQLEIPWQYEPEGYKLSNGQWYLPDFFIPEQKHEHYEHMFDLWVEVKPDIPDVDDSKIIQFANDLWVNRTKQGIIRVKGDPMNACGAAAGRHEEIIDGWRPMTPLRVLNEYTEECKRQDPRECFEWATFYWMFTQRAGKSYWDAKAAALVARQYKFHR